MLKLRDVYDFAVTYANHGPARRNALEAWAISGYQVGQGIRWSRQSATRGESIFSGIIWMLIAAHKLGVGTHVITLLPPYATYDPSITDWHRQFNSAYLTAQQEVWYGYNGKSKNSADHVDERNSRFDRIRLATLIATCIQLMLFYSSGQSYEQSFSLAKVTMSGDSWEKFRHTIGGI